MDKIKTIAMYLPQFHETPENNKWWGEGFTEWTAVTKAEKLFEGHNQPREPLSNNYYNLLDRKAMEQQAGLAKQYGLDGFCFYHYYFKNGKKVLERPAENLLKWKELDMPFCFCWANEGWARTWSRAKIKNVWADKFENEATDKADEVLLEQKYGRGREWKEHFEYLLPFFKDERYIKVDGIPIFLITIPNLITCLAEMMWYWKNLAKENGINDICVIGMSTDKKLNGLDAVLINAPSMYLRNVKLYSMNEVNYFDYKEVWETALTTQSVPRCKTYFGGFTDYDDTPRRGRNGSFFYGASTELFEKYLYLLMKKNQEAGNEFVFINAFNEWGEGMYLEPDKKNGYRYLEALYRVKERVNNEQNKIKVGKSDDTIHIDIKSEAEYKAEKFHSYFLLMDKWMALKEQHLHLAHYLKKYHYNEIAVYGLGILGKHLITELIDDEVMVKYVIDKREGLSYSGIPICKIGSELEPVDVIIVTALQEYDEIWNNIRTYGISFPILSLAELIYDE